MPLAPQEIRTYFITTVTASRKLDVWERSYDSRRITDIHDYTTHISYIHQNPIRAGLTTEPGRYAFSSANPTHSSDPAPGHFT